MLNPPTIVASSKRGRPTGGKKIDKTKVYAIAVKIFAEKGFEGTQLKDIAEKAGISKSLINYHFDGKEGIWKQSVLQLNDILSARFQEIAGYFKDLQGIGLLKAYTRQFIYFSAEYPEFYKIIFHEMCAKTHRATWLIETILQPIYQIGEDFIQATKGGHEILKKFPQANMNSIVIGAANVFFIHEFQMEMQYGIQSRTKIEVERHADIVIELLFP